MATLTLPPSKGKSKKQVSARAVFDAGLPEHRRYKQPINLRKNWAWNPMGAR